MLLFVTFIRFIVIFYGWAIFSGGLLGYHLLVMLLFLQLLMHLLMTYQLCHWGNVHVLYSEDPSNYYKLALSSLWYLTIITIFLYIHNDIQYMSNLGIIIIRILSYLFIYAIINPKLIATYNRTRITTSPYLKIQITSNHTIKITNNLII